MKASFAKEIQQAAVDLLEINRQQAIADQLQEKIKKQQQKDAELQHKKIEAELADAYQPIAKDLSYVRTLIFSAVSDGQCYVVLDRDFLNALSKKLSEYNGLCKFYGCSKAVLPFVFRPFEKVNGVGVFNTEEVVEKFRAPLRKLRSEYDEANPIDEYEIKLSKLVCDALRDFDVDHFPNLETIDEPIIENFISKIQNHQNLERGELLATVSILGGDLKRKHQQLLDEKMAALKKKSAVSALIDKYERKRVFFQDIVGQVVLCWDAEIWMREVLDEQDFKASAVVTFPIDEESDSTSFDILENAHLLSWFGALYEQGFYKKIFDFVKFLAQMGIDQCLISLSQKGLKITSSSELDEDFSFENKMPLGKISDCAIAWKNFFVSLEYVVTPAKSKYSMNVSWQ